MPQQLQCAFVWSCISLGLYLCCLLWKCSPRGRRYKWAAGSIDRWRCQPQEQDHRLQSATPLLARLPNDSAAGCRRNVRTSESETPASDKHILHSSSHHLRSRTVIFALMTPGQLVSFPKQTLGSGTEVSNLRSKIWNTQTGLSYAVFKQHLKSYLFNAIWDRGAYRQLLLWAPYKSSLCIYVCMYVQAEQWQRNAVKIMQQHCLENFLWIRRTCDCI